MMRTIRPLRFAIPFASVLDRPFVPALRGAGICFGAGAALSLWLWAVLAHRETISTVELPLLWPGRTWLPEIVLTAGIVASSLTATGVALALSAYLATPRQRRACRQLDTCVKARTAELTQANHELRRSNRELDDFAYVASHDLKAPLRAIDNLSKWIAEDAAEVLPAGSREHLEKMQQRVQRMEMLLDDLLAYSRAGHLRSTAEWMDTRALVQGILEMSALPKGFDVSIRGDMPTFSTRKAALEQVLRNLIANAVKHHDRPEGRVDISCRELSQHFEFTVADDGPGIPAEFHQRIFRMFQTLRPRDQVEGSGVGLALVKKLVESEGGNIRIDATQGRGATFRFTWPMGQSDRDIADKEEIIHAGKQSQHSAGRSRPRQGRRLRQTGRRLHREIESGRQLCGLDWTVGELLALRRISTDATTEDERPCLSNSQFC